MNMVQVASEVTDDENLLLETISEKEELISKAHRALYS